jgi:hypothetical protein
VPPGYVVIAQAEKPVRLEPLCLEQRVAAE